MNFDQCFAALVPVEGGYVNPNPASDPGGETKYGISKRSYPLLDIANLTLDDAKAIYLRDFWTQSGCDRLPAALAYDMFDTGVNSSPREAIILLQMAVNAQPDGVLGPMTLTAVASMNTDKVLRKFDGHRLLFMKSLRNFQVNAGGWVQRIANNLLRD